MNNRVTHIDQVRAYQSYNRQQVCWLTGMSVDELETFQRNTGVEWLMSYTKITEEEARDTIAVPIVWICWLNAWNRRDEEAIQDMYYVCKDARLNFYRSTHQHIFNQTHKSFQSLVFEYHNIIKNEK